MLVEGLVILAVVLILPKGITGLRWPFRAPGLAKPSNDGPAPIDDAAALTPEASRHD